MSITIYGASDDLIEVRGDIADEFYADEVNLIATSNGVAIRIHYSQAGVWRISQIAGDRGLVSIAQAPEDEDDDNYSDRCTISGRVEWLVVGEQLAAMGKP